MAGKKSHRIRIRSRDGSDPLAIIESLGKIIELKPDRSLDIEIEIGAEAMVPDEPAETMVRISNNKRLDAKHDKRIQSLREEGKDPDARHPASANERIMARGRLKSFAGWAGEKFGGSTIGISARVMWEMIKGGLGL